MLNYIRLVLWTLRPVTPSRGCLSLENPTLRRGAVRIVGDASCAGDRRARLDRSRPPATRVAPSAIDQLADLPA